MSLTVDQQYAVDCARDLLDADRQGEDMLRVTVKAPDGGDTYVAAFGYATGTIGLLLQVISELTANP